MIHAPSPKRMLALTFLVCFLIVSILSNAFIYAYAGHEHDHSGANDACAACVLLQSAERLLKQLGTALAGAFFAIAGLPAVMRALKVIAVYIPFSTPVTLKMRMNS